MGKWPNKSNNEFFLQKSTKPYSDKPVSDNLNYLGALNLKNDFSLHHYEMNVAIVTSC